MALMGLWLAFIQKEIAMQTKQAPLRKGETVLWLGREYRVVDPGHSGGRAELVSVHSHDIIVFVDPAEFVLED